MILLGKYVHLCCFVRRFTQFQTFIHLPSTTLFHLFIPSTLFLIFRRSVLILFWPLPLANFIPFAAFQLDRLVELGLIVITIFTISFGPFFYAGGTEYLVQIFGRLFPFQRGLNHAYWAGNFWALYSALDRILVKCSSFSRLIFFFRFCKLIILGFHNLDLKTRGVTIDPIALLSSSRGLIGSTTFGVLPNITPTFTFGLTLSISLIYLTKLWFDPSYKRFLDSIVLSAMTSFLVGWHVHEKAALLFLVPLRWVSWLILLRVPAAVVTLFSSTLFFRHSLAAVEDDDHFRSYVIASAAGIFGLFPLLIKTAGKFPWIYYDIHRFPIKLTVFLYRFSRNTC